MDHSDERVTDWKSVAPRWVLITALVVSFGMNGLLGTMLASSVTARLDQIERKYADPKWDLLANLADRTGRLEMRVEQHEQQIHELDVRAQLTALTTEVRVLNTRLKEGANP